MTDIPTPLTLSLDPAPSHLWLNLAELRRTHTLLQGSTRAGKSYLIRYLCETLFGQVQQLIFDVEGEYVSLTERFDYALFSAETPVRPDPDAAPVLIRRLLELGTSAIFDLSEMPTPDQERFAAAAAGELVRASPRVPRSVLVIIDEAQRLAPLAGQGEASSTAALRDLANRGLKRGIALAVATQRHSSVDAGLRGAMANLVVGGTPPGLDMETAGKKLGFDAKERRSLMALKRGQFFFLGPAFGDPDGPRRGQLATSGPITTRHMDAGEARAYTPPPASEAMQSLYEQLGDVTTLVEEGSQGQEEQREPGERMTALVAENDRLTARVAALETELVAVRAAGREVRRETAPKIAPKTVQEPHLAPSTPVRVSAPASANPVPAKVSSSTPTARQFQRMETLLAEFAPFGLTPYQLAVLTPIGMDQAENAVRLLRRVTSCGWDGERLTWTAATPSAMTGKLGMTGWDYQARWKQVISVTAGRLLDVLDAVPAPGLSRTAWLDRAAYTDGKNISAALQQLLGLGFVVKTGKQYHLSDAWPAATATAPAKPLLRLEG